jgi:hypothetical protein
MTTISFSCDIYGRVMVIPFTGEIASPAGFEPTTPGLGILCSVLLSYGDDVMISSGYEALILLSFSFSVQIGVHSERV